MSKRRRLNSREFVEYSSVEEESISNDSNESPESIEKETEKKTKKIINVSKGGINISPSLRPRKKEINDEFVLDNEKIEHFDEKCHMYNLGDLDLEADNVILVNKSKKENK
jgi:hypothetical protein